MTKNSLTQRRGERIEAFVERVRSRSAEERLEAAEMQRAQVLAEYEKNTKTSDYRRKVYHK